MTGTGNQFSAADAVLGYLYQARIALLWSLRRLKASNDFLVSLETLDDVAFETASGTPEQLLQTKHHTKAVADLTDFSVDLWKTIRVWFEAQKTQTLASGTILQLLTTATAATGSAASYLRIVGRDVDKAEAALSVAAASSGNKSLIEAFAVFTSTQSSQRRAVLDRVFVIDAAPTIVDLEKDLRDEVFHAVEREHLEPFLARLEGWWLRRVLNQLAKVGSRILGEEVDAEMVDLREQFKRDALPIDDDLLLFVLDATTEAAHADFTFVRQLKIAKATRKRIANAITDFYRAFNQRSRWMRDDLLLVGEISKYERRLEEEWERVFEAMRNEVGSDAAEHVKEAAGRKVLQWAEQTTIAIRPNVTEAFVSRGSMHILSDASRVGWHPEFIDRLKQLLVDKNAK